MTDAGSSLASYIDRFFAAKRLALKSRHDYDRYLREFDAFTKETTLDEALTFENATRFVEQLKERGPSTATNGAAILRSFADWAAEARHRYGPEGGSVLARLRIPRVARTARPTLSARDMEEIWNVLPLRSQRERHRSTAYMRLLQAAGLKRDQARSLLLSDVHVNKQTKRGWVMVTARGIRERRYLDIKTVSAIQDYISKERPTYVGKVPEVLFLTEGGMPFTEYGFSTWVDRIWKDIARLTPSRIKGSSNLVRHTWKSESAEPIRDSELRRRCKTLLTAEADHDQAVREACLVLEDRVRTTIAAPNTLIGTQLMETAFKADAPQIRLSDVYPEQVGALQLYRSVMAFYRNPTGHRVRDDLDRNDALRIVYWIDHLLGLIGYAVARERSSP